MITATITMNETIPLTKGELYIVSSACNQISPEFRSEIQFRNNYWTWDSGSITITAEQEATLVAELKKKQAEIVARQNTNERGTKRILTILIKKIDGANARRDARQIQGRRDSIRYAQERVARGFTPTEWAINQGPARNNGRGVWEVRGCCKGWNGQWDERHTAQVSPEFNEDGEVVFVTGRYFATGEFFSTKAEAVARAVEMVEDQIAQSDAYLKAEFDALVALANQEA